MDSRAVADKTSQPRGSSSHQTASERDGEDLSNPNLVNLAFCKKCFPNFDSLRVHDVYLND